MRWYTSPARGECPVVQAGSGESPALFVVVVPPLGSAPSDWARLHPLSAWSKRSGYRLHRGVARVRRSIAQASMRQAISGFTAADRQVPCSSLSPAPFSRTRSPGVVRCAMKMLALLGADVAASRHGASAYDAGAACVDACQRWGNSSRTRFARCVGMRASTSLSQSWGLKSVCANKKETSSPRV